MAGKQITDLASSDSFSEGDLLLVRKSGMGVDRKITYADFVESIGSPAVDGYIALAEEEQENKIILKAASNAPVYKYYNGMKISFVSPVQSNGDVQIRIGNLGYRNLRRHKEDISVALTQGDYIEAVMIGECFRQVNDLKATDNVYTNDFVVTGSEIAANNLTTDLTLTSAYGLRKQEYYKGMSVLFTCPVDTKGTVRVNVDGLGLVVLKEKGGNELPLNFNEDQVIFAVYDGKIFFLVKSSTVKEREKLAKLEAELIEGKRLANLDKQLITKLEADLTAGNRVAGLDRQRVTRLEADLTERNRLANLDKQRIAKLEADLTAGNRVADFDKQRIAKLEVDSSKASERLAQIEKQYRAQVLDLEQQLKRQKELVIVRQRINDSIADYRSQVDRLYIRTSRGPSTSNLSNNDYFASEYYVRDKADYEKVKKNLEGYKAELAKLN